MGDVSVHFAKQVTTQDVCSKESPILRVAIIIGSTRPGRKAEGVARWVHDIAARRSDASFEVVDIAEFALPLLDEPLPPVMNRYSKPHTKAWAAKIASFDAFVFVTPEYNHSTSGALKNAIDFLYREWNDKAAAFVGHGGAGGVRAVEHLRLVMGLARSRAPTAIRSELTGGCGRVLRWLRAALGIPGLDGGVRDLHEHGGW